MVHVLYFKLQVCHYLPFGHDTDETFVEDPYNYTSGHWLRRDELQRRSRYVKFDFNALCERAVEVSPGAHHIVRWEKREGGFSRAFSMEMDNGSKVVARVPFPVAGPPRLTTISEVANMAYRKNSALSKGIKQ